MRSAPYDAMEAFEEVVEAAGTHRIVGVEVAVDTAADTTVGIVAPGAGRSDRCTLRPEAMSADGSLDLAEPDGAAVAGMQNPADWRIAGKKTVRLDWPYWGWSEDDSPDADSLDYTSASPLQMRFENLLQRANARFGCFRVNCVPRFRYAAEAVLGVADFGHGQIGF